VGNFRSTNNRMIATIGVIAGLILLSGCQTAFYRAMEKIVCRQNIWDNWCRILRDTRVYVMAFKPRRF